MAWDYKRYGLIPDPVHKSHLNELTGEYGCAKRFRYQRDAEFAPAADGGAPEKALNYHLACGTAAHETIARALNNVAVRERILAGQTIAEERIRATFEHELRVAADGRDIDWRDESADAVIGERIAMVQGVFATLPKYVEGIVAVEPGFIVQLEGVWYSGHIDLVYVPRGLPDALGICDWKSGESKPHPIELAHSWEAGIYSAALQRGVFLPRERVSLTRRSDGDWRGQCGAVDITRRSRWQAERDGLEDALKLIAAGNELGGQFTLEQYPARVYHVHMRDFVPYVKAGTKNAKRPEDLEYYGLEREAKVKYTAGEWRGPGWLPVHLHENDIARLAHRTRNVIGTVRMGRFIDFVREHCQRCPFARDCLTGGYSARGDELAELESNLKKAGL
jgi:hypothetical protein